MLCVPYNPVVVVVVVILVGTYLHIYQRGNNRPFRKLVAGGGYGMVGTFKL